MQVRKYKLELVVILIKRKADYVNDYLCILSYSKSI